MNEGRRVNPTPSRGILGITDVEHFQWSISEADTPGSFSANGSGLSLAAAVELASIEAHLRSAVGSIGVSIRVPSCALWSLLKASGWPSNRGCRELRNGSFTMCVLPANPYDLWWTERLHHLLYELRQNGFPTRLARGLAGGVAEMVDNIWQHAETTDPGLLVYHLLRRRFSFSVADIGVGVLASLRKNPRYKWLDSSMEAIGYAIKPGVSGSDGGGMGFPSLLHALADLWGKARIRSGEASLTIDRTQDERRKDYSYLPFLPGLHVSVRCTLDAAPAHS